MKSAPNLSASACMLSIGSGTMIPSRKPGMFSSSAVVIRAHLNSWAQRSQPFFEASFQCGQVGGHLLGRFAAHYQWY